MQVFATSNKKKYSEGHGKTFDPLGTVSPVFIKNKILFQKLAKKNWDEPVDENVRKNWVKWVFQGTDRDLEFYFACLYRCICPRLCSRYILGYSNSLNTFRV